MKIEKVKIKEVILNPNNPRIIKDDKFKKLVKSIKDFPEMLEVRPIVVDDDMIVLGGNMRLKACISAGLDEVHRAGEAGVDVLGHLGREKVNDDVAALELAPGHEQRDGGACGHPREFKVTGDRLPDGLAAQNAAAGEKGDEGHQQSGQNGAELCKGSKQ